MKIQIRCPLKFTGTLYEPQIPDLSDATVMLYEMGEATGSTLEGIVNELRKFNLRTENPIILVGAACIDQTRSRLERVAPGMNIVYGSRWG